jgi:glycosyltransferase involved in cell wall biosynthesis
MGAAGAERARSRYSWELIAEATLDAYSRVIETRARAANVGKRS